MSQISIGPTRVQCKPVQCKPILCSLAFFCLAALARTPAAGESSFSNKLSVVSWELSNCCCDFIASLAAFRCSNAAISA